MKIPRVLAINYGYMSLWVSFIPQSSEVRVPNPCQGIMGRRDALELTSMIPFAIMDPIVGATASRALQIVVGVLSCLFGRSLYRDPARPIKVLYGNVAAAIPPGLARITFRSLGVAATVGGSYLILVALVPSRLLGISFGISMTILFGCLIGGGVLAWLLLRKRPTDTSSRPNP